MMLLEAGERAYSRFLSEHLGIHEQKGKVGKYDGGIDFRQPRPTNVKCAETRDHPRLLFPERDVKRKLRDETAYVLTRLFSAGKRVDIYGYADGKQIRDQRPVPFGQDFIPTRVLTVDALRPIMEIRDPAPGWWSWDPGLPTGCIVCGRETRRAWINPLAATWECPDCRDKAP